MSKHQEDPEGNKRLPSTICKSTASTPHLEGVPHRSLNLHGALEASYGGCLGNGWERRDQFVGQVARQSPHTWKTCNTGSAPCANLTLVLSGFPTPWTQQIVPELQHSILDYHASFVGVDCLLQPFLPATVGLKSCGRYTRLRRYQRQSCFAVHCTSRCNNVPHTRRESKQNSHRVP